MPAVATKKENSKLVTTVRKVKDYSKEPAFKKKAEDAIKFLKKHGFPKSSKKKIAK